MEKSNMYIMTNATGNNNKFWKYIIDDTNTVTISYGRVGNNPATTIKNFSSLASAERFAETKIREKLGKGYILWNGIQNDSQVTVVKKNNGDIKDIALKQINRNSSKVDELIDELIKANIHSITSATTIKYDTSTGCFSTPLGIVTKDMIDEARNILDKMNDYIINKKFDDIDFISNLEKYIAIIPRKIGRKFIPSEIIKDEKDIENEKDILDSLLVSYQMSKNTSTSDNDKKITDITEEKVFGATINHITDKTVINYIINKFKTTLKSGHQSSRLKVKNVYSINIDSVSNDFMSYGINIGNIKELWHGTKVSNLLSIIKNGLIIPKSNSGIHVTGRMFGDGIYASDISTKALNYASGYWSGTYTPKCYMLIVDFAMGKEYIANSYNGKYPVKGYDSTFAKAGSSVQNNEMIVYNTKQCNIKYIVEFDE